MRGEAFEKSNFERCLQDFKLGGEEGRAVGISIPEEFNTQHPKRVKA
jgi:hypothetical protein